MTVEHVTLDGTPALAEYLDDAFMPVEKCDATLVKLIFDDGSLVYVSPQHSGLAYVADAEEE